LTSRTALSKHEKYDFYLVNVLRESNSKGVTDEDPDGAGGCRAENLFKLEALDRKASIVVENLERNKTKQNKPHD
jgi:hypothetical protein